MAATSAEVAARILANRAPVVFLDTAAILDVLRVPFRDDIQADVVEYSTRAATLARSSGLWLVSSESVAVELEGNRLKVNSELASTLQDFDRRAERLSAIAEAILPDHPFSFDSVSRSPFGERVEEIAQAMQDSLTLFRGSNQCVLNAAGRVKQGQRPASKAKQEYKDCEIFEEFLELCGMLRVANFDFPCVFVTSNKNDYGDPPDGFPRIAEDLQSARANYVSNISWALRLIQEQS